MKILATHDLVKILPFDEEFKLDMLSKWGTMSPDAKFRTERMLWDLYDAIFTMKLDEKLALALADKTSGENPDREFYKRIRKDVEDEMSSESAAVVNHVDLTATRDELSKIINDNKI